MTIRLTNKSRRLMLDFISYCRLERGLAESTVGNYKRCLERFCRWLGRGSGLLLIQREDLRRFLDVLETPSTDHITALRQFYRFLMLDGYISHNPTLGIELPRQWHRLPYHHSRDEIREMIERPSAHPASPAEALRDRAILELLYASAVRRSELTGAQILDLNLKDRKLKVDGKGSKQRIVPFGKPAALALEVYLREGRPLLAGKSGPFLFAGSATPRMSNYELQKIVYRQCDAVGLKRTGPHSLRHTCATHMLENGANLRIIQEILGHASVETTAIYAHVALVHVRCQAKLHPRSNPQSGHGATELAPGPIMCTQCRNTVCEKSKCLCAVHLRLAREAGKQRYMRRRRAPTCMNCPNPAEQGKRRCRLHLRLACEDTKRGAGPNNTERDAAIVQMRLSGATLQKIADQFRLTRERIRQITNDARATAILGRVRQIG
jgi:integrase/recombinase XerD